MANSDESKPADNKSFKELRDATRFVTSVEQMIPYLEEIGIDWDSADDEHEAVTPIDNGTHEFVIIYEEYVNYVDMSVLNPLMEPWDCLQKDVLIEDDEYDLSEKFVVRFIIVVVVKF